MGRQPKKKDIAEYLWHSEPAQINATTETLKSKRAKDQFLSFLILREKERRNSKGSATAHKVDKTKIETVEQLMYAYAEHTKYLHTIGDRYGWDEGTYRANVGKIKNYIVPLFGSYRIWEITSVDLRQGFKDILQLPQANGNHKSKGQKVSQRNAYDCKKNSKSCF